MKQSKKIKRPSLSLDRIDRLTWILLIVIACLTAALTAMIIVFPKNIPHNKSISSRTGNIVELGSFRYDFSSGKAVKRPAEDVRALQSFLESEGAKSIGKPGCDTVYHQFVAASPDEHEILLRYGCSYPSASMYVVKQDGAWKVLSPTNQFDIFGIPLCSHVESNDIDRTIAPVCGRSSSVNLANLTYEVR